MNLLDTGVNHEHMGQPRQTHPPVATVDANVLSTCIIYLEPKWPLFCLELGPCFGGWNRLKIVHIQRFLTLPTPNLSHPTASLGRLLCGSQMSRFPISVIWLKIWSCGCAMLGRPKQKYQQKYTRTHLDEGKMAFREFVWFGGKNNKF